MKVITFHGERVDYDIPDMWVAGVLSQHKDATIPGIIAYWHEQELLERQWKAQQRTR